MTARRQSLLERFCRALSRLDGNPEDTSFKGEPMWHSYKDEAQVLCKLIGLDAFLADVRVAAADQEMPEPARTKLVAALSAFEDGA
jgi:hypothetical protein